MVRDIIIIIISTIMVNQIINRRDYSKLRILVFGGAGYIGSHIVHDLVSLGCKITVFDNLSTGSINNIPKNTNFINGDILNISDLERAFDVKYDYVMHFAALKAAGDSMHNPSIYSKNNIVGSINILNSMVANNIKNIIFSSSAAVYGNPEYLPLDENHKTKPINFYGFTKLQIENILKWYSKLDKIKFVSLRYFNAAGYDVKNRISTKEFNTSNLIPIVMETASGYRRNVEIYGSDYNTKDGTCLRDYIHVNDLSEAHIRCIDLFDNNNHIILNLATGTYHSVLDVIKMTEKISNKKINYTFNSRRIGDPDVLYSSSIKSKKILDWIPKYSSLEQIIQSTWNIYNN